MSDAPEHNMGRATGDSQSHDHEKRDRTYAFESGGTVQAIPGDGNYEGSGATRGYGSTATKGGNAVK